MKRHAEAAGWRLLLALLLSMSPAAFAQEALVQYCGHFESLHSPHGIFVNNLWNAHAAGERPWRQCVEVDGDNDNARYGWSWSWPEDGQVVFSYPQVRVGVSPWDPKERFDKRFPAALDTLESLDVAYTLDIQAEGKFNVATSMWLTDTADIGAEAQPTSIVAEVMIWTSYTGQHMRPAGRLFGELDHAGARWEVWVDRDWHDVSGLNDNRWIYLAFRRTQPTLATSFDAAVMLSYARDNDLLPPGVFIADVELGTEITSGAGQLRVESFSVDVR